MSRLHSAGRTARFRTVLAAVLGAGIAAVAAAAAAPPEEPAASAPPRPPIAPYTTAPLSGRVVVVPMTFPLLGGSMAAYSPNYNTDRGSHRHTGQDLRAPKMRPIVAPFSGVLGFKPNTFWIYGDNGYRCLGTHLNDDTPGTGDNRADPDFMFAPNLRPGDRVVEGQLIGYVGDSGDATGPHLHFELFTPEGELVSPVPSLRKARSLSTPKPPDLGLSALPAAYRPAAGEALVLGCPRAFDPARRILTLLLVARRGAEGVVKVAVAPERVAVTLTPEEVAAAGGAEALRELPRDQCVGALVPANAPRGRSAPARRLLLWEAAPPPEHGAPALEHSATETQAQRSGSLELLSCIGKGFAAYEKTLGKPASVDVDTRSGNPGENRTYAGAALRARGITEVHLSAYQLIPESPGAVTLVRVFFPKGARLTWQEALDSVGLPKAGVEPVHHDLKGLNNGTYRSYLLGGLSFGPGVPASEIVPGPYPGFDVGYGVTWFDTGYPGTDGAPVLQIRYENFARTRAVPLEAWRSHAVEGAEGTMEVLPDGAVKLTTTKVGREPWGHAAWVASAAVEDGGEYLISFEAKADAPRRLWVFAELNERPWSPAGLDEKNVALGTEWQRYTLTFRATGVAGRSVRIPSFFVGDRPGTVYIRRLTVRRKLR